MTAAHRDTDMKTLKQGQIHDMVDNPPQAKSYISIHLTLLLHFRLFQIFPRPLVVTSGIAC